jgi:hypothetical protein
LCFVLPTQIPVHFRATYQRTSFAYGSVSLIPNNNNRPVLPLRQRAPWDLPTYSPTSLNQYAQCPEAFLHERVIKTSAAPDRGSDALAKGSATHALLERYIGFDAASRTRFVANLAQEAQRALMAQGLSSNSGSKHAEALADVVAWATNGIDVVETELSGANLLVGEQFLNLRWDKEPAQFRLLAKIDLLAIFSDGVVESLDWKTGAARSDQLQNVICRLVTEANAPQMLGAYLPDGQPTEIRTAVCNLGTRELTVQVFDHRQLAAEFSAIRDQVVRIEQAKAHPIPGTLSWRPQPGPLCRYCKFASACSYYNVPDNGATMAWLDNALDLPS